ncbi:MAG TPA: hypothetical protein PK668_10150 [Myxococcota bacterium]|nr:hypothetical protein [Myxococcota bacterium]HRY93472.1 hypothetical protein [Myxococcota bacterium]HSA23358.1 hypothetical protein [Myxococcota bacterium]
MRIEGSGPAPAGAGERGEQAFRALLDRLARQDCLSECLALQTDLRAAEHTRLRCAAQDRREALHRAERALREAREEEQRFQDAAETSDGIGLANGVLSGLVSAICWWGGLLHGLSYAAHLGQATYCRERAAEAQREQVRQAAAKDDSSQRAQALLQDMQPAMELERRMRERLLALVEGEQRSRRTALEAGGGEHAGGADG